MGKVSSSVLCVVIVGDMTTLFSLNFSLGVDTFSLVSGTGVEGVGWVALGGKLGSSFAS